MQSAFFLACLCSLGANLNPSGEVETIKWNKKTTGHLVGDNGVTFEVEGPTVLVFELRGAKGLKNSTVTVTIERDGTHVSTNALSFKQRGRGPRGFPTVANIGLSVPDGSHHYTLTADAKLAVLAATAKRLRKRIAAAPEKSLSPPVPEPASAPAETTADASAAAASEPAAPDATTETAAVTTETTGDEAETAAEAFKEVEASSAEVAARIGSMRRGIRVAVYDLELQGIDKTIGNVVTDSVVAEVRKLEGVSAIGMDEIRDMLSHEANKQILGCEADESCLAEIAGALGVDDLVTGSLSKAAASHVFVLRRIDQNRATVAGTVNKRLKAESGQEFLVAIGPAIEELFPDRALRAGAKRGVAEEIALRLDPPPLPTWSFWTTAGTAAGLAAAGGVFGLLALDKQDQYNRQANDALTQVVQGSSLKQTENAYQQHSLTANILWIASGALAIAAGVMIPFTDWQGYGDQAN